MDQKRVYKRIEDLVEVEFISSVSEVTTIIRTKTRDISAGGIKVYLNHRLSSGDKMQMSIILPKSKEPIKAEAEVVSSELIGLIGDKGEEKLYATRFKFGKISLETKNKITAYVFECRKNTLKAKYKED
ncbi:MAG: PilZ domain-containing protein [Candidatus Omnitrophica bacterium]|nr:PilZ domain-containing protein [Candidatus Omnitrophota bacterium]